MIEHTENITELTKALLAVQGTLSGVKRDSVNPHFKNRYASLEAVIEAAREPLQKNGVAFTQAPGAIVDGAVEVTTMLMHKSGEWLRSTLHVPLAKTDPQGVGSAITYGCRYALMATLGLPPTDDDAEAAVGRGNGNGARPAEKPPTETAAQYVTRAKGEIAKIKAETALRAWWQNEKATRDAHKLAPDKGPGLELITAYGDRKAELQAEVLAA